MADPLQVEVVPWGPGPERSRAAAEAALADPVVVEALAGAEHRLLAATPLDSEVTDPAAPAPTRIRATVYDYTNDRTLLIDTSLDGPPNPVVSSISRPPRPSEAERAAALDVLRSDPELGARLRDGSLEPYRPMPPLLTEERPDGTLERAVTIGLRTADHAGHHEIVAVSLGSGEITRFPASAPPASAADHGHCGLPDAGQTTAMDEAGSAVVTVKRGGETLWRLIVTRPAASSGVNGSGVELRAVRYRGKRVLRRAHVPILNVRYDGDACGPYRDWQNQEGKFTANGQNPAPGFRLCSAPAQTILESLSDHGNFLGVAVYVDGDEVVLVSELEAGWYRYISLWRLHADGTIRPRFAFGAVTNSCVCNVHHHHVYWRLDFDIVGAANNTVREFNDPPVSGTAPWHTLRHEQRRRKSLNHHRRWQVRNRDSGESYTLVPGPNDGREDAWGIGDLWALRHRGDQTDDGQGFTADPDEARAHLNRFVNGESIYGTDVVLWYAAHFTHDIDDEHVGHMVGPDLVPGGW